MNDELIKGMVKLKLKMIDSIINKIPESIKPAVKKVQKQIIEAIYQGTGEYIEKSSISCERNTIKKVSID